jgi:L-galactono-1,4-lactone dehydrogenase
LKGKSFTELRGVALSTNPLETDRVRQVNAIESEFWKQNSGVRVGWSHEILQFDCGDPQWVCEVAFPVNQDEDLKYMEELLELIEKENIPAPCPIEQRWTSASKSVLSPAYSENSEQVFSWVGIIMYLPTDDENQNEKIKEAFYHYKSLCRTNLWEKYNAIEHWAKLEIPSTNKELEQVKSQLSKRFPMEKISQVRKELDPKGILRNKWIDTFFS